MAESLALRFGDDLSGNSTLVMYYYSFSGTGNVSIGSIPSGWSTVLVRVTAFGNNLASGFTFVTSSSMSQFSVCYTNSGNMYLANVNANSNGLSPGTAGNMILYSSTVITGFTLAW